MEEFSLLIKYKYAIGKSVTYKYLMWCGNNAGYIADKRTVVCFKRQVLNGIDQVRQFCFLHISHYFENWKFRLGFLVFAT